MSDCVPNLAIYKSPADVPLRDILLSHPQIHDTDCDEETGLLLLSHDSCSEHDSPLVRASRSVVVDSNGDHVLSTMPFTEQFTCPETLSKHFPEWSDPGACVAMESLEGTVIRVFCYAGKWFVSTFRSLDARNSRWMSAESFGNRFRCAALLAVRVSPEKVESSTKTATVHSNLVALSSHALDACFAKEVLPLLKESECYVFLLRSENSNRIGCKVPEWPKIHLLFRVGKTGIPCFDTTRDDVHLLFPSPPLVTVDAAALAHTWSESPSTPPPDSELLASQGIVLYARDGTRIVKLYSPQYATCVAARGESGSLRVRYMQLLRDDALRSVLRTTFPECSTLFDSIDADFAVAVERVFSLYIAVKVRKMAIDVPKSVNPVIWACHSWHCQDRQRNIVSRNTVKEHLSMQSVPSIIRILRCTSRGL